MNNTINNTRTIPEDEPFFYRQETPEIGFEKSASICVNNRVITLNEINNTYQKLSFATSDPDSLRCCVAALASLSHGAVLANAVAVPPAMSPLP